VHHRSIQASLGCAGVAATGGDHGSLDCRISQRGGGNDFVSRLHRGRIHLSGVIRAARIGRSQAGCLVPRGVRACAQRPPPRLPHARRGIPAGLVDESRRDATLHAQVGLLRRVYAADFRSRRSVAKMDLERSRYPRATRNGSFGSPAISLVLCCIPHLD